MTKLRIRQWFAASAVILVSFGGFHEYAIAADGRLPAAGTGGSASATATVSRHRVALVIGNGAYRSVPELGTPARDAHAVCGQLKQLGFDVECVENARTRSEMRAAVDRYLRKMAQGSVGVFYFAGHGVQKRGENFLLPVDAQINRIADIDEESLSLSYVMEAIAEAHLSLNLVVVDACRENMLPKSLELALPRGFRRYRLRTTQSSSIRRRRVASPSTVAAAASSIILRSHDTSCATLPTTESCSRTSSNG